ncbi:MAG: amidohydrolase family protein [Deltaproteobacteria bacterium]|nr:amidohydrolase family protein [Deltaproteobacteria bacterium]
MRVPAAQEHEQDDLPDGLPCCFAGAAHQQTLPAPALDDVDGVRVGDDLPPVFDAHVHVFPPKLFEAVWRWFDVNGWPIRHKLHADDVVAFLKTRGIAGCLLLHYAHKPGIAREMNRFVADVAARSEGFAHGTATVCPGEPDQVAILEEAFALGLSGIKLHCHVQGVAVDDDRLFPLYELCQQRDEPVVVHAGREPWSAALPVDPHAICDVERTARVLRAFPHLRVVVPHLGADEFAEYAALMCQHENLWLDTTMMVAGYFSALEKGGAVDDDDNDWIRFVMARPERVLYGSDFPGLPYAWDREIKALTRGLKDPILEAVLGDNARALFKT